jgi:hypothetical protein
LELFNYPIIMAYLYLAGYSADGQNNFSQKDTVIEFCLPELAELNAGCSNWLRLSWV